MAKCFCGLEKDFSLCCEVFIRGDDLPPTPEALMRSRYSAYCQQNMDYLLATTDPQTLHKIDHHGNAVWAKSTTFTKLEILQSSEEGSKGIVEFKAQYQTAGEPMQTHHEISKFRKQNGKWYFREGRAQ